MDSSFRDQPVKIVLDGVTLPGDLSIPPEAGGIVLFAHGSGSSRLSPRNVFVARQLQQRNIATLLFDLLTEEEDSNYATRFDIRLLTDRLILTTGWLQQHDEYTRLPLGFFGASTGSAAALRAAAALGSQIHAVVSRGGRPDLAMDALPDVRAATLLIVGGADTEVLALNRQAFNAIHSAKELAIVPGATHLFEEPGTLEEVARLAGEWFTHYLLTAKGGS